ncbi:MAG: hypothetical protein U5Q44_09045 [Dehalococcoidia bacterium]|nr:hypothetical protein [Dehalococcoidia bacterium]
MMKRKSIADACMVKIWLYASLLTKELSATASCVRTKSARRPPTPKKNIVK